MENHAICLLTYVAEHPDEWQSYAELEKHTGVPKSTIWELLHWSEEFYPGECNILGLWACNLGYCVWYPMKPGKMIEVYELHR